MIDRRPRSPVGQVAAKPLPGVAGILSEIFATSWLVTEDASAHIYNAVIMRGLMFRHDLTAGGIFKLNHVLVPNYLGHAILAGLTSVFSLEVSDKIFHILLIAGLCFSFRF